VFSFADEIAFGAEFLHGSIIPSLVTAKDYVYVLLNDQKNQKSQLRAGRLISD
jgi:hypothetical protein